MNIICGFTRNIYKRKKRKSSGKTIFFLNCVLAMVVQEVPGNRHGEYLHLFQLGSTLEDKL